MLKMADYLEFLQENYPEDVVVVEDEVNPADFEVTAILRHLEKADQYPLVYFKRPLDLNGAPSAFPIVTNIFASRERCALALGIEPNRGKLPLSLEYAAREARRLPVVGVPKTEAGVKENVFVGEEADLRKFPIVRHHEMDLGPYIDMVPIMRDPESGAYNACFQRTMYKGPRKLGIHMSPRHNWEIVRRQEAENRPTPVVIVGGHHPSFSLAALNVIPFDEDDYEVIGSVMDQPLRVTPSETWGEAFMVPADAEILIEGEILPGVREIEAPFGEYTGYYGPQRYNWVIEVKAICHRNQAIYQNIFTGHRETLILGGIPKEGNLFKIIKGVVPTVKAVHLPISGCSRFNCYISLDKKTDGDSKQAALIAMGAIDFVKNVIVVDGDIDPFNEEQVMWAVATRVQADRDVDIIKNAKGSTLDPSLGGDILTAKIIIDATKPLSHPFADRISVPESALERTRAIFDRLKAGR